MSSCPNTHNTFEQCDFLHKILSHSRKVNVCPKGFCCPVFMLSIIEATNHVNEHHTDYADNALVQRPQYGGPSLSTSDIPSVLGGNPAVIVERTVTTTTTTTTETIIMANVSNVTSSQSAPSSTSHYTKTSVPDIEEMSSSEDDTEEPFSDNIQHSVEQVSKPVEQVSIPGVVRVASERFTPSVPRCKKSTVPKAVHQPSSDGVPTLDESISYDQPSPVCAKPSKKCTCKYTNIADVDALAKKFHVVETIIPRGQVYQGKVKSADEILADHERVIMAPVWKGCRYMRVLEVPYICTDGVPMGVMMCGKPTEDKQQFCVDCQSLRASAEAFKDAPKGKAPHAKGARLNGASRHGSSRDSSPETTVVTRPGNSEK